MKKFIITSIMLAMIIGVAAGCNKKTEETVTSDLPTQVTTEETTTTQATSELVNPDFELLDQEILGKWRGEAVDINLYFTYVFNDDGTGLYIQSSSSGDTEMVSEEDITYSFYEKGSICIYHSSETGTRVCTDYTYRIEDNILYLTTETSEGTITTSYFRQ